MNASNNRIYFDITHHIKMHMNHLIAFANLLTQNKSDAEDLYQDTILLALRYQDKFTIGTNFLSWLKTIMRNRFINQYRRKRRHQKAMNTPGSGFFFKKGNEDNSTEVQLAVGDLNQLIEGVAEIYRTPFLLHYQGYSYEEIAVQMEVPLGTVKSRIFYARQHLRKAYKNLEKKSS